MEQKFIMTAFGKDRPGIVAEISEIIFEHQCYLEDSNMGRLADEFTLILLLSGKGEDLQDKLSMDCKRLEREKQIFVFIRPLDYKIPVTDNGAPDCTIQIEAVDQVGIVYKVSRMLSEHNVNIETLRSKKKFLPNSGTALYSVLITVTLPQAISLEALGEKLDTLAQDLNVDISLKP